MKTILLIRCDNRNLVSVEYVQIHIKSRRQSRMSCSCPDHSQCHSSEFKMCLLGCLVSIGSFSLHFFLHFCHGAKKICEVFLQQAWCFVCVLEFQLRKKEKSNVQTQHVVGRNQNEVVLLNVNCYKSACVWGVWVTCLYSVLPPLKKTSLNSNVKLPASQTLYISKLVAPKFDLRYEQWKISLLLGFADSKRCGCMEKVTQVHILPTWWWKMVMENLGRIIRIRKKSTNKQTNPEETLQKNILPNGNATWWFTLVESVKNQQTNKSKVTFNYSIRALVLARTKRISPMVWLKYSFNVNGG